MTEIRAASGETGIALPPRRRRVFVHGMRRVQDPPTARAALGLTARAARVEREDPLPSAAAPCRTIHRQLARVDAHAPDPVCAA